MTDEIEEPSREELASLLYGEPPDWDEEPEPATDQRAANGRLRALGQLQEQLEAQEAFYLEQRDPLDRWIAGERKRFEKRIRWLEQSVVGWHLGQLDEYGEGSKTVRLPAGTLEARKQPDQWTVTDEGAFLDWARANRPELIRRAEPKPPPPPAPALAEIKRAFPLPKRRRLGDELPVVSEAGEVIPGMSVVVGIMKVTPRPDR